MGAIILKDAYHREIYRRDTKKSVTHHKMEIITAKYPIV